MGLFSLFAADPEAGLDRAERFLAAGDAVRALDLARRLAARGAAHRLGWRVGDVVARAEKGVAEAALEKAEAALAAGYPEDAVDWLRGALDRVSEPELHADLVARLGEVEARCGTPAGIPEETGAAEEEVVEETGGEPPEEPFEMGTDERYALLVDTLDGAVAERYRDRPETFVNAYLELNEGRPRGALPLLDGLLEKAPEDAVVRFERGRARLLVGDAPGAREDLETAWPKLGDAPLDLAGSLSVPALWAEAVLSVGEPQVVVERLGTIADPDGEVSPATGLPDLYAEALLAAGRGAEARRYLERAAAAFPTDQNLAFLLASGLAGEGDADEAIAVLDEAVAPSCALGDCSRPPLHVPSLRLLASLLLQRVEPGSRPPERVGDLLALLRHAQGGRLGEPDRPLAARYRTLQVEWGDLDDTEDGIEDGIGEEAEPDLP